MRIPEQKLLLPRATPEALGISGGAVAEFLNAIYDLNAVHSFMLLRHGHVAAEAFRAPYAPGLTHNIFSISKSFTSLAAGLAAAEGKIKLDDPVTGYFPELLPRGMDARFEQLTLRHLLMMRSGHAKCALLEMIRQPNWVTGFFSMPPEREPGRSFIYDSAATYVLAAALCRATGTGLQDYLYPRLLAPLGIARRHWELSPQGVECGGWGYNLTTEELAAFGQFLLDGVRGVGSIRATQVPPDYLAEATSFQTPNPNGAPPSEWNSGYGYLFWLGSHGSFRADGAFGQCVLVVPSSDMVLVVTAGLTEMHRVYEPFWKLIHSQAAPSPLPADPCARECFSRKAGSWHFDFAPGERGAADAGAGNMTLRGKFDANPQEFKSFSFTSGREGVTLEFDGQILRAGFEQWEESRLQWLHNDAPDIFLSRARLENGGIELHSLLPETPFQWHLSIKFDDGRFTITPLIHPPIFWLGSWQKLSGELHD